MAFDCIRDIGDAAPFDCVEDHDNRAIAAGDKDCAHAVEIVAVAIADLKTEAAQAFTQGIHRRDRVSCAEALQANFTKVSTRSLSIGLLNSRK
jgi:hypothetical protein